MDCTSSYVLVSSHYSPPSPDRMDWSQHYPSFFAPPSDPDHDVDGTEAEAGPSSSFSTGELKPSGTSNQKQVEWADVGCGFGGLLMDLAPKFPDTLMLGEPSFTHPILLSSPASPSLNLYALHR